MGLLDEEDDEGRAGTAKTSVLLGYWFKLIPIYLSSWLTTIDLLEHT